MSYPDPAHWLPPLDFSALDASDPGVLAEAADRWEHGALAVLSTDDEVDPLQIALHLLAAGRVGVRTVKAALIWFFGLLGALSLLAAIITLLGGEPTLAAGAGAVALACAAIVLPLWRTNQPRLTPALARKELLRQVRVAAMAERNGAANEPDQVYAKAVAAPAPNSYRLPLDSFTATSGFRADWGDVAYLEKTDSAFARFVETTRGLRMRTGPLDGCVLTRCTTFFAVRLPVRLPHIVIDGSGRQLRSDASVVPISRDFDTIFRVLARPGYEAAVASLLPEPVQAGLAALAYNYRITLSGNTLFFERNTPGRFDTARGWQAVWDLREFVAQSWYPFMGGFGVPYVAGSTDGRADDDVPDQLLPVAPLGFSVRDGGMIFGTFAGLFDALGAWAVPVVLVLSGVIVVVAGAYGVHAGFRRVRVFRARRRLTRVRDLQ